LASEFGEFKVEAFGSTANGLCLEGIPDIDISISFYNNPYVEKEKVLRLISKSIKSGLAGLLPEGDLAYKEVVKTMTPLIKYIDKSTDLHVDIVVNGILGVKNS